MILRTSHFSIKENEAEDVTVSALPLTASFSYASFQQSDHFQTDTDENISKLFFSQWLSRNLTGTTILKISVRIIFIPQHFCFCGI